MFITLHIRAVSHLHNQIPTNSPDSRRGTTDPPLHQVNPEPWSSVQSDGRALRPFHDGHGILQGSRRAETSGDHILRHRVSGLHHTVLMYVLIILNHYKNTTLNQTLKNSVYCSFRSLTLVRPNRNFEPNHLNKSEITKFTMESAVQHLFSGNIFLSGVLCIN